MQCGIQCRSAGGQLWRPLVSSSHPLQPVLALWPIQRIASPAASTKGWNSGKLGGRTGGGLDQQNKYDYMLLKSEKTFTGALRDGYPLTIRLFLITYLIHWLAFETEFGDRRLGQHRVPTSAITFAIIADVE